MARAAAVAAAIAEQRRAADDHGLRAAERGRDDDHVALQRERAERTEIAATG